MQFGLTRQPRLGQSRGRVVRDGRTRPVLSWSVRPHRGSSVLMSSLATRAFPHEYGGKSPKMNAPQIAIATQASILPDWTLNAESPALPEKTKFVVRLDTSHDSESARCVFALESTVAYSRPTRPVWIFNDPEGYCSGVKDVARPESHPSFVFSLVDAGDRDSPAQGQLGWVGVLASLTFVGPAAPSTSKALVPSSDDGDVVMTGANQLTPQRAIRLAHSTTVLVAGDKQQMLGCT